VATHASITALSGHETKKQTETNMPFLFWMPMIVMCGLWRAAEDDAKTYFMTSE
jgi:hypothetical protein